MDDKILRKLFYVFLQNDGWQDFKKTSYVFLFYKTTDNKILRSMYFYKENIDFRFSLQSICGWSI